MRLHPPRALRLAGAGLLTLGLFLPWSHQFDASFLTRYATSPALSGVPHHPDAWQLYTFADVLLALLAGAIALGALSSRRSPAWPWLAALIVAAGFTVHALIVAPTNGANVFDPARRAYAAPGASAGVGEWVALAGLALASAGVLAPGERKAP